jgi:hypothetical protein
MIGVGISGAILFNAQSILSPELYRPLSGFDSQRPRRRTFFKLTIPFDNEQQARCTRLQSAGGLRPIGRKARNDVVCCSPPAPPQFGKICHGEVLSSRRPAVLARFIPGYDPSLFDSRGAEVRIWSIFKIKQKTLHFRKRLEINILFILRFMTAEACEQVLRHTHN